MQTIKIKRKISSSQLRIAELKNFIGKQVEITITEEASKTNDNSNNKLLGILSEYKDIEKMPNEKLGWV